MASHNTGLTPANICIRDNTPYSLDYNDFYYSKFDGIGESRYVFIEANRLWQRWQAFERDKQKRFSIFETGFGSGLNFLLTVASWLNFQHQQQPKHLKSLVYTSVEAHPLAKEDLLAVMASWPQPPELSWILADRYPPLLKGLHPIELQSIKLNLMFMRLDQSLAAIEPKGKPLFDCLYLDGFAPAKNTSIWQPKLYRRLSYYCKPHSTFSTFTASGHVRRMLEACGYQIKKIKGFGKKREMLTGVLNQARTVAYKSKHPWYEPPQAKALKKPVIIIGAGISGCATAYTLARHGIKTIIIESSHRLAGTLGDFPASIFSPYLSADFNRISQFYWTGYQYIRQFLRANNQLDHAFTGQFYIADDEEQRCRYKHIQHNLKATGLELDWVSTEQTSTRLGQPINLPGILSPHGGWLNSMDYCECLCSQAGIDLILGTEVRQLTREDDWTIQTTNGCFSADHVVLCTGSDATLTRDLNLGSFERLGGQMTAMENNSSLAVPERILNNGHYLIPYRDNQMIAGASFVPSSEVEFHPRLDDDKTILCNFKKINNLVDRLVDDKLAAIEGMTSSASPSGIRLASRDHLPVIGPVPDMNDYAAVYPACLKSGRLKNCPEPKYYPGLFINFAHGSRGVTASLLAGDIIAALLTDQQLPVPTALWHAIHPARFFVRDHGA